VLIASAIFYQVALDSDAGLFGGFGRIHHAAEHFTTECPHDNRPHSFSVYTPSRTCVVYAPADTMTPESSEESKYTKKTCCQYS